MASVEQAYFRNIIPRYENEEHNNKSKAGTHTILLNFFRHWFPYNGFVGIEQQMTAIKHRYREKINKSDTY